MSGVEPSTSDEHGADAYETFNDVVKRIVSEPLEKVQIAVEESLRSQEQSINKSVRGLVSQVTNIRRGDGVREISLLDIERAVQAVDRAVPAAQVLIQGGQAAATEQVLSAIEGLRTTISDSASSQADTVAETRREIERTHQRHEIHITELHGELARLRVQLSVNRWLIIAIAVLVVAFGLATAFIDH